jgi:hypothetical protein
MMKLEADPTTSASFYFGSPGDFVERRKSSISVSQENLHQLRQLADVMDDSHGRRSMEAEEFSKAAAAK